MKHILLTTACIIALAAGAANAATTVGLNDITRMAQQYKVGGDGVIMNSSGQEVARFNSATNRFLSVTGAPITDDTQASVFQQVMKNNLASTAGSLGLNGGGSTVKAGIAPSDRTDPRYTQKNTYVASSDDGSVYYGNDSGKDGIVAANSIAATVIKAAETHNTSTSTNPALAGLHLQPGGTEFVNAAGQLMARYNPTTGQITTVSGEHITPNNTSYAAYQAALSAGPLSTSPTAGYNPGTAGSTASLHLQPGGNEINNANNQTIARYNPTTGQFTTTSGVIIPPGSPEYDLYKSVVAARGAVVAFN